MSQEMKIADMRAAVDLLTLAKQRAFSSGKPSIANRISALARELEMEIQK